MTTRFGDVESGWEAAYAEHDGDNLWQEDPIPVLPEVIDRLRTGGVRTILELGCGDGRNLRPLVAAGFTCLGVDLSPSALARAAAGLSGDALAGPPAAPGRWALLRGSGASLPLPDDAVHAVTCLDVFGQLPAPEAVLAEMARVLVDGGVLAFTAYSLDDSEYGRGVQVAPHTFEYRGTMFRFYDQAALRDMLAAWDIEKVEKVSWVDPPHGRFRPQTHTHDNWLVFATPRRPYRRAPFTDPGRG